MTTFLFFVSLLGFFLCYNTSRKVKLKRSTFLEEIAQKNPKYSKMTGSALMIFSLIGALFYWGTGAGIFAFVVILMTAGSAVVLLTPLRYVGYKLLVAVFVVSFIIELTF